MFAEHCPRMLQGKDLFLYLLIYYYANNVDIWFSFSFHINGLADNGYGNNVGRDNKLCPVLATSSGGKWWKKKWRIERIVAFS